MLIFENRIHFVANVFLTTLVEGFVYLAVSCSIFHWLTQSSIFARLLRGVLSNLFSRVLLLISPCARPAAHCSIPAFPSAFLKASAILGASRLLANQRSRNQRYVSEEEKYSQSAIEKSWVSDLEVHPPVSRLRQISSLVCRYIN